MRRLQLSVKQLSVKQLRFSHFLVIVKMMFWHMA